MRLQYLQGLARLPSPRLARGGSFDFEGRKHQYVDRCYNFTWINERRVELAFVKEWLAEFEGRRVLEIGNVSSHYFGGTHFVIDRYEDSESTRVIAEDAVDFSLEGPFDLIFSISTFEHLGWDESLPDPDKVFRAIAHARSKLSASGVLRITVPIGFNPHLDRALVEKKIPFERSEALMRIDSRNSWEQVPMETALQCQYGSPYPFANAVVIGEFGPINLRSTHLPTQRS